MFSFLFQSGSLSGRSSVGVAFSDSSSNKGSVRSTKSLVSPTEEKNFELSDVRDENLTISVSLSSEHSFQSSYLE